jgi:putative FmdB family regulatory protein
MPIYLYKCPECETKREVDHPMMDEPQLTCDNCNVGLKKLPGVGAVSFKGSGWGSDR